MKTENVISFFGKQGKRYAQVYDIGTEVGSFAVDLYDEDVFLETKYYETNEQADKMAQKFAFNGEY